MYIGRVEHSLDSIFLEACPKGMLRTVEGFVFDLFVQSLNDRSDIMDFTLILRIDGIYYSGLPLGVVDIGDERVTFHAESFIVRPKGELCIDGIGLLSPDGVFTLKEMDIVNLTGKSMVSYYLGGEVCK